MEKNYQIILITKEKASILAIVKSPGLAYKVKELFKEIYKNQNVTINIEQTRKKLNEISVTEYYLNNCKI